MEHLHISKSMNDYYFHWTYSLNNSSPGQFSSLSTLFSYFSWRKLKSPNSSKYIHCPASLCITPFSTDDYFFYLFHLKLQILRRMHSEDLLMISSGTSAAWWTTESQPWHSSSEPVFLGRTVIVDTLNTEHILKCLSEVLPNVCSALITVWNFKE